MRDKQDLVSEWTNYREAHPDDEHDDLDIYLDETVYKPDSPYWPHRDGNGTLID